MKALIVYDSTYGNTEMVAKAIGAAIGGDMKVVRADEVYPADLRMIDLLIVGSPTYGGRPTPAIQSFLDGVSEPAIRGVKAAAFDTRYSTRLVGVFGYAADKIDGILRTKGGTLISPAEGFFVKGKKGPLKPGELEHAASWAAEIVRQTGSTASTKRQGVD